MTVVTHLTAILAQGSAPDESAPFWDNKVLDSWEIPFGSWMEELINWSIANLGTVLDAIKWPFSFLFRNFVNGPEYHPWWEITDMPWILVCGAVAVIGTITRNLRFGIGLSLLLAMCGLLGNEFWEQTVSTIGLVVVAVVMGAVIGIPIGVLCGRIDGVWKVVRPVLDAMQVVHAFVYIIPFIFFFGLGPEPATMVTMVFAVPPLIRLTNLGIRQVPGDVVEAARAYGASKMRVLLDVQLPLARPAIMTGLNQTLLLSISMIGIAAIMGASGLGLLLYRGLLNLDTPLSVTSGLALFIVAVVLDRLSQTEAGEGTRFFARIRLAWQHRRDPEVLLEATKTEDGPDTGALASGGVPAPVGTLERAGALVATVGGLVALVSVFLPWGQDSGLISGYGRDGDLDRAGQVFGGLAAEGGSFFGLVVLATSLVVVGAGLATLTKPGGVARWFGADGALLASLGVLAASSSYVWIDPHPDAVAYLDGIGVWIALAGGIVAVVGSAFWIGVAPYSQLRPMADKVSVSRVALTMVILGLLAVASLSSWSVDSRAESVITPELQAEIDRLTKEGRDDPSRAGQNAITIVALTEEAQRKNPVHLNGFTAEGPGLGVLALGMGVLGLLFSLPAAGLFGSGERRRWIWSTAIAALGVGMMAVSAGWIASLVRTSDPNFVSGPGAFLCLLAGFLLVMSSRGVLQEFRRTEVYATQEQLEQGLSATA